jgi:hypothetical protein
VHQRLAGGCPAALQAADVVRHGGNPNDVGHGRRGGTEEGWALSRQTLCSNALQECRLTALQCTKVVRHQGNLDDVGRDTGEVAQEKDGRLPGSEGDQRK